MYVKASRRLKAQTHFAPRYRPAQMCLSPLPRRSRLPHPSQKCTLGAGEVGASAKPTICRRLEINDRPKPSGSPSHSAASVGSADGSAQPSLLFFFFLSPPTLSPKSVRARPLPVTTECASERRCVLGMWGAEGGLGVDLFRWSAALYSGEWAGGTAW